MQQEVVFECAAKVLLEKVTVAREFFHIHRSDPQARAKYLRAVASFRKFVLNGEILSLEVPCCTPSKAIN
jgi:hypothetical protein